MWGGGGVASLLYNNAFFICMASFLTFHTHIPLLIGHSIRPGSADSPMQFRFNGDFNSARNILIACSMLMEDTDKTKRLSSLSLNNVGTSVSSGSSEPPMKTQSLSRSFHELVKAKSSTTKEEKGGNESAIIIDVN